MLGGSHKGDRGTPHLATCSSGQAVQSPSQLNHPYVQIPLATANEKTLMDANCHVMRKPGDELGYPMLKSALSVHGPDYPAAPTYLKSNLLDMPRQLRNAHARNWARVVSAERRELCATKRSLGGLGFGREWFEVAAVRCWTQRPDPGRR